MCKNTTGKQNILGYQHTSTGGIPNRHKLHFSKMYVGCRVNGSHHSLWQRVANPSTILSRADTVVSNNFTRHVIFILQISAHWYFPQILESKFSAKQKQKKNKNPIFNILVCHISSTVDSQIYVHYNSSAELIPPGCYFSTSTSPFPPSLLQSPQRNKRNHFWKSSQLFPALPNFCDKTEDDCFFSLLVTSLPLYLRISSKIPFHRSFWWRWDYNEHQRTRKAQYFLWQWWGF